VRVERTQSISFKRRMDMTRYLKYIALGLLGFAILVPAASARPVVFVRGYFGPGWYGPAYYGWYGPAYGAPFAVYTAPNAGKVKFDTKMKDAGVYVDGGFAGTVKQLGTFSLRPGTHNIELRDPAGQTFFQEKVDVLVGKTIKLAA
jgi:hypothetical protein